MTMSHLTIPNPRNKALEMIADPAGYFREARARALAEVRAERGRQAVPERNNMLPKDSSGVIDASPARETSIGAANNHRAMGPR